jgi:hypothetical protein
MIGTMLAAVKSAPHVDALADDDTPTPAATGCERMDRTLKAIERVRLARNDHLKRLVIVVTTGFTSSHFEPPF